MSKNRIQATLYMESKIVHNKGLSIEHDQDGYLFADGVYRTKIYRPGRRENASR